MPIGTPVGNLDIANATLRTSNLETQNIKIGSIFVGTGNSLEETANVGNSMSNTIQFTNTHTAFTTTGNVTVGKELTVTGNVKVGTANLFVDTVNSKVGLGTVSPAQSVHVSKVVAGGVNSILVSNPDGNIDSSAALKLGVSSEDDTVAKFGIIHERKSPYGGGDTYFCTNYATDTTEVSETDVAITILGQNKHVGIKTGNPAAPLEVVEGTTAAPLTTETTVMQLNSTIGGSTSDHASYFKFQHVPESSPVDWRDWSGRLQFVTDATNQGYMEFNPSGSEYGIAFGNTGGGSAAGEIMRLLGTGQVGIGYNNPSDKLEVNGNIRANHLNLDGTQLVNNLQIASTAGTWHKLADTSALTSGLYIFQVTWGSASDNHGQKIWSGGTSFDLYVRAGISGIFNSTPSETISHNPVYHYRTVGGYLFGHDSNSVNGNYGHQTIYIQSPQSSVTMNGLSVVAYKIG